VITKRGLFDAWSVVYPALLIAAGLVGAVLEVGRSAWIALGFGVLLLALQGLAWWRGSHRDINSSGKDSSQRADERTQTSPRQLAWILALCVGGFGIALLFANDWQLTSRVVVPFLGFGAVTVVAAVLVIRRATRLGAGE
jgi:hypothetical protein